MYVWIYTFCFAKVVINIMSFGYFRALYMCHYDHFSSVARPSVRPSVVRPLTFSNDFSSEAAEPVLLRFHIEPP